MKANKVKQICYWCNKLYEKRFDRVREVDFCSVKCRGEYINDKKTLCCEFCGEQFVARMSQVEIDGWGRFCSKKCRFSMEPNRSSAMPEEHKRKRKYEYQKLYMAKNRELYRTASRKSRAKRILADGTHSKDDVQHIKSLQKNKCAICNCKLGNSYHVDHINPLARGGTNDKYNLQILCPKCNLSKWAKDPIEHMQSMGLLI